MAPTDAADPPVLLFGFVFLVVPAIDDNVLQGFRVREESLCHGTRAGFLRGPTLTGGVIASAGTVLAATSAAPAVVPIMALVRPAVVVAFAVLMAAMVVRSRMVPAPTHGLGRVSRWPFRMGA